MKIIGIGSNYVTDVADLPQGATTPLIFTKPDSSLLTSGSNLTLPSISKDVWYEIEIAFRIGKEGKNIKEENALEYVDALTLANDLTAKDVLEKSRETIKGPWALAKGFDGATPVGEFISITKFKDIHDINFSMNVNGEEVQRGNTSMMITKPSQLIAYVSMFMTLQLGDILLTGTPSKGAGKIYNGDLMEGYLEGELLLSTQVN